MYHDYVQQFCLHHLYLKQYRTLLQTITAATRGTLRLSAEPRGQVLSVSTVAAEHAEVTQTWIFKKIKRPSSK